MKKVYPCDLDCECPYNAFNALQCYNLCGLGADENGEPTADPEEMVETPSRDLPELSECLDWLKEMGDQTMD